MRICSACGREYDPSTLTARERQVISLVAQGYANKEVGQRLGISRETVNNHMSNIADKLGARNRTHAAMMCAERGLLA